MPTFVRKTYIREAVSAIINQTYQNFELIIKSGIENDDFEALQGLDLSKVRLISSKDRGITDAMNQMMRQSIGDVLMWCNDDDILSPTALETIAKNIGEYKWGFGKIVTTHGDTLGCPCSLEALKHGNYITQPSVFWTREAYTKVGDMNEDVDLVSDYEYWVRLMKEYKPIFIDEVISMYRVHDGQITNTRQAEQYKQAQIVRLSV